MYKFIHAEKIIKTTNASLVCFNQLLFVPLFFIIITNDFEYDKKNNYFFIVD